MEGTAEPDDDGGEAAAEKLRDSAAAKATRDTVLESAGLSPRAVSAARGLGAGTVGDLLGLGSKQVISQPGVGVKTRRELQRRIRQWRSLLGDPGPAPRAPLGDGDGDVAHDGNRAGSAGGKLTPEALARTGLDDILARLIPDIGPRGRNATVARAVRLVLGLPDLPAPQHSPSQPGQLVAPLPPWPRQPLVADALGVTSGRVAQILSKQRGQWRDEPLVGSVRDELVALLEGGGRVMGVTELAAALLARRGSAASEEDERRAVSLAAVRAAVEVDAIAAEPRLLTRRHGDRLLVALEATEDDSPGTPSAPALLDYADALGRAADRLAGMDVLPAPATVLRELSAVRPPLTPSGAADAGTGAGGGSLFDERRLVQVAAIASQHAACSPRLEIYPRNLDPVRALRLAQAGIVPRHPDPDQARLRVEQIHARVGARFPDMTTQLPDRPALDDLLAEAGFDVVWRDDGYATRRSMPSSTGVPTGTPTPTRRTVTTQGGSRFTAASADEAVALVAGQRLERAAAGDGFRALTVRRSRYTPARTELARRFGAEPVDVGSLFLDALHAQVDPRPLPTWATILAADVAEPGSKAARKFGEYVEAAWDRVRPQLFDVVAGAAGTSGGGPVLLHDAAPLARYRAMDLLYAVADRARSGGRPTWLLCPVGDPGAPPRIDGEIVQVVSENEWIRLPDAWAGGEHRTSLDVS